MAQEDYKPSEQDAADMLFRVLEILREAGIQVAISSVPAKNDRPAGLVIFAGNVTYEKGKGFLYQVPAKAEAK